MWSAAVRLRCLCDELSQFAVDVSHRCLLGDAHCPSDQDVADQRPQDYLHEVRDRDRQDGAHPTSHARIGRGQLSARVCASIAPPGLGMLGWSALLLAAVDSAKLGQR